MTSLAIKEQMLMAWLQDAQSVLVAFSGGVDSTFLLAAARRALPRHRVLGVTGLSPSLAEGEAGRCVALAALLEVDHQSVQTDEFSDLRYLSNPANRCFFCKQALYADLVPRAKSGGFRVVVNGLNLDDMSDIRPGTAAAEAAAVQSPLRDVGLTKSEIRRLSQAWRLPTWDRPASPCLSSRVAFGTPVSPDLLQRVDHAEQQVRALGFSVVRVRTDGQNARIELGSDELPMLEDEGTRPKLLAAVQAAGFSLVAIDPQAYRIGGAQGRALS
jgi:uncharacterized protein